MVYSQDPTLSDLLKIEEREDEVVWYTPTTRTRSIKEMVDHGLITMADLADLPKRILVLKGMWVLNDGLLEIEPRRGEPSAEHPYYSLYVREGLDKEVVVPIRTLVQGFDDGLDLEITYE